jgi:hypothetical protein
MSVPASAVGVDSFYACHSRCCRRRAAGAQRLGARINYPTAGIPRTRDGREPDLSGLWQPASGGADPQFMDIAKDVKGGLPFRKWAADW